LDLGPVFAVKLKPVEESFESVLYIVKDYLVFCRDIINLVCNHLELYRLGHSKIKKHDLRKLPIDCQDTQLRLVLAAANKLHPALFSSDAERKVLLIQLCAPFFSI